MFDSLKKKLLGFLGKKEDRKETKPLASKSKEKKKKQSKTEQKKEAQSKKETKKAKKSPEIIKEERETTQEIIEDIKKEQGEDIKSIPQMEAEESKGFFSKIFKKFTEKITTVKIEKNDFEEIFSELELILLENNVAIEVVDKIKENLENELVGKECTKKELGEKITSALKESILNVLIEPENLLNKIRQKEGVFVMVFFGINGVGKTTSLAKIASYLKENKIQSVMVAGDTFRAASIEQLKKHAEKLSISIIAKEYGSDPASVAFDAISYAKKSNIKVVLIDTAGRMYTKSNLMKEMEKIIKVSKPDLKLFVGESITGNDAVEQARTFNETVGIDGIILNKADVDEKAGTILSVSYVTKKPIYFLGTGQEYKDITPFTKKEVIKNLGLD